MVEIFGNKTLDELGQSDVQELIDNHQEENIILEFKRELTANSKEIAKDISSMANSEGGIIIYGINEDQTGKANSIEWIDIPNFKERLENIIATTITPQVSFKIFSIQNEGDNTKFVHLILVPKSNNLHMVVKENDNRYYKRLGRTIQRMEDSEIKERIQLINFNRQNINSILSLLKSEFHELTGTDLESIGKINYYVIPDELGDKTSNIGELRNVITSIRNNLSEGIDFDSYKGTISNSMFSDGRKWHRATIIHKTGIIEFRRSHEYAEIFGAYREAELLLKLISLTNDFYRKIDYYGGYKIYIEIGNLGRYAFNPTWGNTTGVYEMSIGALQESINLDPLLVQESPKNNLKILELIKTVGGTVGVNGDGAYQNIKTLLSIT